MSLPSIKNLALFALGALLLTACGKEYTTLPTSPTITQGIYGTVVERWGDWQPHPGSTVSAGETPISNDIYVYEYTTLSDLNSLSYDENGILRFPIDSMPYPLVATTASDSNGFYQIQLPAGHYSVLLLENGMLYFCGFDSNVGLMPVTVDSGQVVRFNLVLDHAIY